MLLMIRDIRRVLVSNVWVGIVGVASSLLFPKILSIGDYAQYQTFALYLSYVGFFHLGVSDGMFVTHGGLTRASVDRSRYKGEVWLLILVLTAFAVAGLVGSMITGNELLAYLAVCVVATNIFTSYRFMLQAWGEFQAYSLLNLALPTVILIGAGALYVLQGGLSGENLIAVNVLGYATFAAGISFGVWKFTRGHRGRPAFSRENMQLWKTGFSVMIGGIVTIVFLSVGRQFVLLFYSSTDFAMYSFAMSMQAIMTLFIGAIAQPMYWRLASGRSAADELQRLKEVLLVFGAVAGVAYFVVSIFVDWYVPKYHDSLAVMRVYFTVFPAMSVINCLYVNLYKTTRQIPRYVRSVVLVLVVTAVLSAASLATRDYVLIAAAASVAYYGWLVYGAGHFCGLAIRGKDVAFLLAYLALYLIFSELMGGMAGGIAYAISIGSVAAFFYRGSLRAVWNRLRAELT
jgi:O-antigen/teichoic acid export membrane protein